MLRIPPDRCPCIGFDSVSRPRVVAALAPGPACGLFGDMTSECDDIRGSSAVGRGSISLYSTAHRDTCDEQWTS